MTKREVVLSMLTNASHGVTGREFVDAGVFRYSARIKELRDRGYEIESKRLSQGNFQFRLVGEPTGATANPSSEGLSQPAGEDSSGGSGQLPGDPLPLDIEEQPMFACDLRNSPFWELD